VALEDYGPPRDLSASIGQTRLLAALQMDDTVSLPRMIVVASWAFILFVE
jgi:hypothetical protein